MQKGRRDRGRTRVLCSPGIASGCLHQGLKKVEGTPPTNLSEIERDRESTSFRPNRNFPCMNNANFQQVMSFGRQRQ